MRVSSEFPPNIEDVRAAFDLSGREMFAWGNTIFNPSRAAIPAWLLKHEEVHERQQGDDVEGWWARYLVDADFRFEQELEAHQVEYKCFCLCNKDRNARVSYLYQISLRLCSPMYGKLSSLQAAMKLIKE